jgi:diguanylate cyclase (GGDEF)-like protein
MSLAKLNLQEKLRAQAIHDPLTGLLNRRYLEEILARDLHRAHRRHADMSVVMLDLDNFKRFNDTFGHAAGDSVLRELGRVIRGILRKTDIICRYGGDEFVLVMSDSTGKDSRTRMEEIGARVKEVGRGDVHAKFGWITFSAGIAQAGPNGSDSTELLHAADRALYVAKAAGGDRVAIYQEENEPNKPLGS